MEFLRYAKLFNFWMKLFLELKSSPQHKEEKDYRELQIQMISKRNFKFFALVKIMEFGEDNGCSLNEIKLNNVYLYIFIVIIKCLF